MKKILHSTWKQFQKCRYWKDLEVKENLTKLFKGCKIILRRVFGDGNEVILFVAEAVIEVCKEKDWNIPEKQNKYCEDDKFLWSNGFQKSIGRGI